MIWPKKEQTMMPQQIIDKSGQESVEQIGDIEQDLKALGKDFEWC